MGTRSNILTENIELISKHAEAMALKITGLMETARRAADLDELHALVQDLVVIRQAALAIKEEAEDAVEEVRCGGA